MSINNDLKKYSIEKLLFVFIVFADISFMALPRLSEIFSSVANYHTKVLVCFIVLTMCLLYLFKRRFKIKINRYHKKYSILPLWYIGMVVFTIIISMFVYGSEKEIIQKYYYYVALMLFFVLFNLMGEDRKFCNFILKTVMIIGTLYAIYAIVAKIVYMYSGSVIMNKNVMLYTSRDNTLRLNWIADFVSMSTLFSLIKCGSETRKQRKMLYFLSYICGMFAIFYVSQTRIYEIALIIITIIIFFEGQKGSFQKLIIGMLIILCIYIFYESILEFINSFTVFSYSTDNRLKEYYYFLSQSFRNYFIGIGFVPPGTYDYILYGPSQSFYLSDCGYIGMIGVYGVIGAAWILSFWIFIVRIIKKSRTKPKYIRLMLIGIGGYLLITNITVSFNDIQRIIYFPIMMSLLCYYDSIDIKNKQFYGVKGGALCH